jgi:hypothetical protein
MWTVSFWKAVAERAVSTFAQGFLAALPVTAVGFGEIDWLAALSIGGVAGVLSIVKSLIANQATGTGPSVIQNEIVVSNEVAAEIENLGIEEELAE